MAVGSVTSNTVVSTRITGEDYVSPVTRALESNAASSSSSSSGTGNTPYTEQEWYIRAKVSALKSQIETYSTLPGLDPSGAVMDSLTKEVNDLVGKQQAKLKKSQDEAAAKQKELDAQNAQKKLDAEIPTSTQLLQRAKDRANGIKVDPFEAPDDSKPGSGSASGDVISSGDMLARAKAAADKKRGGTVNVTA